MSGASKAGFKYAVLTTKHHDGYALWDSDWALMGVRQSLNGFDLVKPFVDACRNNNLKVDFIILEWIGFLIDYMNFAIPSDVINYQGKRIKKLPKRPISRWETYKEFNERQVVELISKFQPDIWWGDSHGASLEKIRSLNPVLFAIIEGRKVEIMQLQRDIIW